MRALEKAPGHRYQSADQMRADIRRRPVRAAGCATRRPRDADGPPREISRPSTSLRPLPHQTRRLAGVLAVAVLLVIGFAGLGYFRSHSPENPSTTEVPAVLGFSQAQAESLLRNAHLVPRVERVNGPSATQRTVTGQSPAGGRVAGTNSTVTIQISTGPAITVSTAQPTKPTPTAGRPKPVKASTSGTPRPRSSERSQASAAAKAKQSAKSPQANKPGKAKSRTPKSRPQPNKRN